MDKPEKKPLAISCRYVSYHNLWYSWFPAFLFILNKKIAELLFPLYF